MKGDEKKIKGTQKKIGGNQTKAKGDQRKRKKKLKGKSRKKQTKWLLLLSPLLPLLQWPTRSSVRLSALARSPARPFTGPEI